MKLIFCMQINIKVSYKLISELWFSHQYFLQGDANIIDARDQAFSEYSKYQVCNIFTIPQKRG